MLYLCDDQGMSIDIASLPSVLAVIGLSYAMVLYAKEKLSFFKCDHALTHALFLVFANPFMLSILSYRYSCVSMVNSLAIIFILFFIDDIVIGNVLALISMIAGE